MVIDTTFFFFKIPGDHYVDQVIWLCPKMYSYILDDGESKQLAKGIKKYITKNMSFNDYKTVLDTTLPMRHEQNLIRSRHHSLYIERLKKSSLSLFDNKRFWIDKYRSLAFGNPLIPALRGLGDHDYDV